MVADCKYGTSANFIALASQGIRAHMGDLRSRLRNHHEKDIYPAERFKYDESGDTYKCPAGRLLYRHHFNGHRGSLTLGHALECVRIAGWPRTAPARRRGAA